MQHALPFLAFSMGLLSSFHCIGMCGPIALALPVKKGSALNQLSGLTVYNGGRALTYSLLGLMIGTLGSAMVWIGYLRYLSILAGVIILGYTLLPSTGFLHPPQFWQNIISQIKSRMAGMLKSRNLLSWFVLGLLNGLLPCGMVYLALISSMATGSSFSGGLFMLIFGAGTLPAMMAVGFFKQLFTPALRSSMRKLTPILLAAAGIWMVARGIFIQYPAGNSKQTSEITICHGK
jgi:uncharacterized protein